MHLGGKQNKKHENTHWNLQGEVICYDVGMLDCNC